MAKPTPTYTHDSHPARKAARAAARHAARTAPGLDFSAPAITLVITTEAVADFMAELEALAGPRNPCPQPGPVAEYSYAPNSALADLLRLEAGRVMVLVKAHARYVPYDREDPDSYADTCSPTWSLPWSTLLALDDASPEARFVAQELYRTLEWSRPWRISPLWPEGLDAVQAYVTQVALRVAPFVTPGNTDLFGQ